jgi:hypothetical protein
MLRKNSTFKLNKKNASIWFPTAANAHLGGDFFVIARIGHFRQKSPVSKMQRTRKE